MGFMKEEDDKDSVLRGLFKKKKMLIGCILILVVIAIAVLGGIGIMKLKEEKLHTVSKASLEKMIQISDLYTLEYTYNAITYVNDDEGNPRYHVAYKGTVTAGIDFSKVQVDTDEENKKIKITIPDAYVQNVDVDMGKMEFIFEKKKYETETVSQEAYAACKADLEQKAAGEQSLLAMAKDNAKEAVTALIEPWVQQIDKEYTLEIN